jgi:hypothetical protein
MNTYIYIYIFIYILIQVPTANSALGQEMEDWLGRLPSSEGSAIFLRCARGGVACRKIASRVEARGIRIALVSRVGGVCDFFVGRLVG